MASKKPAISASSAAIAGLDLAAWNLVACALTRVLTIPTSFAVPFHQVSEVA